MKCQIQHESCGRLRVHLACTHMTLHEADVLEYYIKNTDGVEAVQIFDRTCDAVVSYRENRSGVLAALAAFSFQKAEAMDLVPAHTPRQLNREFEDKLAMTVMRRAFSNLFLPLSVRAVISMIRSVKYLYEGLKALWHGKLSVAVLDATAVTVSMIRGDFILVAFVVFLVVKSFNTAKKKLEKPAEPEPEPEEPEPTKEELLLTEIRDLLKEK